MSGIRIGRQSTRFLVCALAVCALVAAVILGQENLTQGQDAADQAAAVKQAKSLSTAFRAAAKKVLPTVVTIRTMTGPPKKGDATTPQANPFRGTPWERFFDDQTPGSRWHMVPQEPQSGLGSGVIIDPSGVILTNNHVEIGRASCRERV